MLLDCAVGVSRISMNREEILAVKFDLVHVKGLRLSLMAVSEKVDKEGFHCRAFRNQNCMETINLMQIQQLIVVIGGSSLCAFLRSLLVDTLSLPIECNYVQQYGRSAAK